MLAASSRNGAPSLLGDPPRGTRLLLTGALVVGFVMRLVVMFRSAPLDDAYITFRYAQNLAAGLGFVYNAGERVLGTTTPLCARCSPTSPISRSRSPRDRRPSSSPMI